MSRCTPTPPEDQLSFDDALFGAAPQPVRARRLLTPAEVAARCGLTYAPSDEQAQVVSAPADRPLVVVDLKTGRTQAKEIDTHGQLAAYQVAVAAGAFGEHGDAPGGASLLQVGSGTRAKEQAQDPLPADVPVGETWAGELVAQVGDGMGAASFEVRTGSHCSRCPARRSCPLHERGRQVTS